MKRLVAACSLIFLLTSLQVSAQTRSQKLSVEQLANSLAEAYAAKDLGRLDALRPYFRGVRIDLSHSLLENSDVIKRFRTLALAERWLRSLEVSDGVPARGVRPLLKCSKGVCEYNYDGGILHNHLYLQEFTYGFRNGRLYIKTISILDGD
jgi:hypothetical protein